MPEFSTPPGMMMKKGVATVAQLDGFDEIIDARTPAEFAEDHLPGAINLPVLDNEQRIVVGTIYKQQSAFEARRIGAAMVAANIARHLQGPLKDKPRNWRPLIYCWRGGQRSGSFATWLRMVGWDACQLEGGYKAFRHHVIAEIERIVPALDLKIICGPTGSGKTRVLESLQHLGAQVLDLEHLAAHKGSVLGALPDREQPQQKAFETAICTRLQGFDPGRPVFVEAESRKIGRLFVPEALILAMRRSDCIAIQATRSARLEFLLRDYAYLGDDPELLQKRLRHLSGLHSNERLAGWLQMAQTGALPALFAELVDHHYDPLYQKSQNGNYVRFVAARAFETDDLSPPGILDLADRIFSSF